MDTKDILFVVGGAFNDLDRQVMESRTEAGLGFGNKVKPANLGRRGGQRVSSEVLKQVRGPAAVA